MWRIELLYIQDNNHKLTRGGDKMTVRERILTIRLMDKVKRDYNFANQLGIRIVVRKDEKQEVKNARIKI